MDCKGYKGCGRSLAGTPADLAGALEKYERSGQWVAEPKLDGQWVCLIGRELTRIPRVIGRSGRPVATVELPTLPMRTVLIGEYVKGLDPTVWIFDVLADAGRRTDCLVQRARRAVLEGLTLADCAVVPQWSDGFFEHFAAAAEGLVLKRKDAGPYRPGKSEDWVKVKKQRTYDMLVAGWDGFRRSLELTDGPRDCGKVPILDRALAKHINDTWPAWDGRTVEVAAFKQYPSGALRSPVFLRLRPDL